MYCRNPTIVVGANTKSASLQRDAMKPVVLNDSELAQEPPLRRHYGQSSRSSVRCRTASAPVME